MDMVRSTILIKDAFKLNHQMIENYCGVFLKRNEFPIYLYGMFTTFPSHKNQAYRDKQRMIRNITLLLHLNETVILFSLISPPPPSI